MEHETHLMSDMKTVTDTYTSATTTYSVLREMVELIELRENWDIARFQ